MNKKKVMLGLGTVSMVGALAVGGTLAYLTNVTETVTNVFTSGNDDLGGKIVEEFESNKASSFLPGDAIKKVPQIQNDADSVEAWVAVKVTVKDTTYADTNNDAEVISYDEFTKKYGKISTASVDGFNTTDYEEITPAGVTDYKLFVYKSTVPAGSSTREIFDTVTINAGIESVISNDYKTTDVYKEVVAGTDGAVEIDGKYYVKVDTKTEKVDTSTKYYVKDASGNTVTETDVITLPKFDIDVKGYMVQAQNVDFATAKAQLTDLAISK